MKAGRLLVFAIPLLVCIGCDQATKRIAECALAGSAGLSLAGDALRFELVSNPGGFLSLGAELPGALRQALFVAGVPLLLALLCAGLLSGDAPRRRVVGAALLAGGGLGNWLDRLLQGGAVTDFVSVGVAGLRTGVFNVADVAVGLGIALVLWTRGRGGGGEACQPRSKPRAAGSPRMAKSRLPAGCEPFLV